MLVLRWMGGGGVVVMGVAELVVDEVEKDRRKGLKKSRGCKSLWEEKNKE